MGNVHTSPTTMDVLIMMMWESNVSQVCDAFTSHPYNYAITVEKQSVLANTSAVLVPFSKINARSSH